jgi:ribonuclease-3
VITRLLAPRIAALPDPAALKDSKTRLQEYLQARSLALPRYEVERIEGEPHSQTFRVSCEVAALGRRVHGGGSSRRRAEQEAAARMLHEIGADAAVERRP